MGRTYVALDTEATGLRSETDEIIEIGAVKFRDGQVLDQWQSFIRPTQPIPYKVSALTGITWPQVQRAPTLFAVAPALLRFLGDCHIVGHSIEIDLQLLHRQGVRTSNRAYDTFELATLLLPEVSVYNLVGVADALNIPAPVQHRAMADAELAMHVFEALVERLHELPLDVLVEINRATAASEWPLRFLFQEVEREAARATFQRPSASIRTKLAAAGLSQAALDLGLLQPPALPDPLPTPGGAPTLPLDEAALVALLAPDGPVAAAFPDYEHRPQQIEMLRAITRAFNDHRHLLVEAATGTGKSLAYLLPAIQFALDNDTPVVIAVSSPALQEQIFHKDLPALHQALAATPSEAVTPADAWEQALAAAQAGRGTGGRRPKHREAHTAPDNAPPPPFRTALLKAQGDYLCLRRWGSFRQRRPATLDELRMLVKVLIWLPRTTTGDRAELLLINNEGAVWSRLAVTEEGCPIHECVYHQKGLCFHYRARRQAEAAHVLVVSHALLLADIASGHSLLPPYRHLIVDEAHHLEEEATEQLGYQVDLETIVDHLNLLSRPNGPDRHDGLLVDLHALLNSPAPVRSLSGAAATPPRRRVTAATLTALDAALAPLHTACAAVQERVADLFARLTAALTSHSEERNEYDKRLRLTAAVRRQPTWGEIQLAWESARQEWSAALDAVNAVGDLLEETAAAADTDLSNALLELRTNWRTGYRLYSQLDAALAHPSEGAIYWLAANSRESSLTLRTAPLHVGELLDRYLFRTKDTVVLTSATLSTEGDFTFMRERLSLNSAQELHVLPPYTYERSVMLYIPEDMPEPNQPGYQRALERALIDLCVASQGRALVLFTSHSALRATYRGIARPLEEAGLLVLGHTLDGSKRQLLERFRRTPRTVLLGTSSFWEGLENLDDALRVLAITKLPFNVPSDPIFAARSEQFDDAFTQFSLPQTVLRFKQGVGRLIRARQSRGVIALLDRRVISKHYGSTFLNSLPSCTVQYGPANHLTEATGDWLAAEEAAEGKA